MKEEFNDSVIPDTHKWILVDGDIVLDGIKLGTVPLRRCQKCKLILTTSFLHGLDSLRVCLKAKEQT